MKRMLFVVLMLVVFLTGTVSAAATPIQLSDMCGFDQPQWITSTGLPGYVTDPGILQATYDIEGLPRNQAHGDLAGAFTITDVNYHETKVLAYYQAGFNRPWTLKCASGTGALYMRTNDPIVACLINGDC